MMISSPVVADLLGRLNLTPVHVYRDGPRFWVGHVRRDGRDFVLKQAVAGSDWYGHVSGKRYASSDRLVNEIAIMDALVKSGVRLAGRLPHIVDASTEGEIWVLRELTSGISLSRGRSNFLFNHVFFESANWRAVIDFVLSLQQATDQIRPLFESNFDERDYSTLEARIEHSGLLRPSAWIEPHANAARTWLAGRAQLYDGQLDVMIHGEMYSPHIFIEDGQAVVIDWENAMMGSRYQDLAPLWVRGYARPEWQDEFVHDLEVRGLIAGDDDRQVWATATLLSCIGSLNHLPSTDNEPRNTQREIFTSLTRHVERILQT